MRRLPPLLGLALSVLVALALGALVTLAALSGLGSGAGRLAYDACLGLRGPGPAPVSYLVVAPTRPGATARLEAADALDALRLLDEFGAQGLVLYGSAFVGAREGEELALMRRELPAAVDRETANIEANFRALMDALRSGSLPPGSLSAFIDDFSAMVQGSGERIKASLGARGSDGLAALDAELLRLSPRPLPGASGPAGTAIAFSPDSDGLLRRLPSEGGAAKDGQALVAWAPPGSAFQPRRLALGDLLDAAAAEEAFVALLGRMEASGLLVADGGALLSRYRHASLLLDDRDSGKDVSTDDWREARAAFFSSTEAYFADSYEDGLHAAVEVVRERSALTDEALARLDDRDLLIDSSFKEAREGLSRLLALRARLGTELRGSLVFLSAETAAAPGFGRKDATEAASPALAGAFLAASIGNGRAPRSAPRSLVLLTAGLLSAAALALSVWLRKRPVPALVSVFLVAFLGAGTAPLAFAATGLFIPPLAPALAPLVSGLAAFLLARRVEIG